ncbi:sensor histidine kinase [Aequitasia blattaphilus]|uniref:histidine kinase n=1 Tax=Aequitasia blattaphilus TaxID=2949332 RepID=A0ABT1E8Y1_9FIRM|nr:ATP-binding protein [Aequitasia blattaphilus]MCP1102284.1 ATP-binding protein [Aequitasia blattaphilus]MCR8614924.1 ATP-binding protein [Aequitasia blattaphilus]
MCTQSGELVTISGARRVWNFKYFRSMRVLLIVLLIIAGILPAVIMKEVITRSYETRAVNVKTAEIQNQCNILCDQIAESNYLSEQTSEVLAAEITQLSNIYNGRIMVIDNDYKIVEDTYEFDEGKTIISHDVVTCFKGKGTTNYDRRNKYIEVTSPVLDENKEMVMGVMLVSVSTNSIADTISLLENTANVVMIIIAVFVVLFAFIVGTRMVKPLNRITSSIEAVTEGYDEDYLHENAYLETRVISDSFNKMLGRMKTLDDTRKEFVSNVSHELKTPLTSMKVLADSLLTQEDVPNELYKEFMEDLSKEIERENDIINDLLSLVKMDKTNPDLNMNLENINEMIEQILKRLRPVATLRNIELVFESLRPVTAAVDKVKLSLAISNLVENAIKYNNENGWVHVRLNADHKWFTLEVADSGIGIPEDSIGNIFERFYRVDKSHSREIGGTGLGLAITRSAVLLHRGSIKVFSEPEKGTTFSLRIPLTYVA